MPAYTHKVTLESNRGPIEVQYRITGEGVVSGEAYFTQDDLLAEVGPEGDFSHPMTDAEYRVLVPRGHTKSEDAVLLVRCWRTEGRAKPAKA